MSDLFNESMKRFASGTIAADMARMFSGAKLPMPELTALMEMHRRNLETLTVANKMIFEGAQAIGQRQMELVRRQMTDLTEAARSLSTASGPGERAVKQTELLKSAYQKSVDDLRELEDLLRSSSTEALSMVHKRFLDSLDELKLAVEKEKPAG